MTTEAMKLHPELAELRAPDQAAAQPPVARVIGGLTFLAGLYLAISPWVIGFTQFPSLTANDLIVGIALAVLALGVGARYGRTHATTWVAPVIGVWTIIAALVVSGPVAPTAAIWSNAVTGAVAVLLGLSALTREMTPAR